MKISEKSLSKRTESQELQKSSVREGSNLWNWQPLQHFQLFCNRPRGLKIKQKGSRNRGFGHPKPIKIKQKRPWRHHASSRRQVFECLIKNMVCTQTIFFNKAFKNCPSAASVVWPRALLYDFYRFWVPETWISASFLVSFETSGPVGEQLKVL